ncbi:HAD family hydrolase [Halospeciosus flavus]|uniref:HAD family hydrolase n=1 Tax=Halospeciosus flavus TaxID=3032283 RepID=A0ABD5Z1F0_9EURY|nr:HAD family hydrolase [Halospeciosus flavus]
MPTDIAVYFGLDGTLVHPDRPFEDVVRTAFERCDYAADDVTVEAYCRALGDLVDDCEDAPYARAVEAVGLDVDPELFDAAIHVVEPGFTEADPDATALLSELARFPVGVLTHGEGRMQRAKLDACGLTSHFDAVVVSGEVGAGRPDPELYALAEERLPAAGHALVAHDLQRDVHPAVEYGWTGVHLGAGATGAGGVDEVGDSGAVIAAESLTAVPGVLDVVDR